MRLPKHKPRRLYRDDEPESYLESDRDYFENNSELIVLLLDAYSEGRVSVFGPELKPPPGYTAEELERDNPYNQWMNEG